MKTYPCKYCGKDSVGKYLCSHCGRLIYELKEKKFKSKKVNRLDLK